MRDLLPSYPLHPLLFVSFCSSPGISGDEVASTGNEAMSSILERGSISGVRPQSTTLECLLTWPNALELCNWDRLGVGSAVWVPVHNSMGPNDRYRPPSGASCFLTVTTMLVHVMAQRERAGLESCRSRLWGLGTTSPFSRLTLPSLGGWQMPHEGRAPCESACLKLEML